MPTQIPGIGVKPPNFDNLRKVLCASCHRTLATVKQITVPTSNQTKIVCPFCGAEIIGGGGGFVGNSVQKNNDNKTIIGIMVDNRIKSTTKSYILLFLSLVVQLGFSYFTKEQINGWLITIVVFLLAILFINQKMLEYRVKKGYYGATEYEAREIIEFILNHADKTDFTDNDGLKKLMPDPEIELQRESIPEGGVTA